MQEDCHTQHMYKSNKLEKFDKMTSFLHETNTACIHDIILHKLSCNKYSLHIRSCNFFPVLSFSR